MREGFEIGTWHKIIGGKCDEEVARYLMFAFESWVTLMGSKKALQYVDTEDVKEFQSRVPGISQADYYYLAGLIEGGTAFKKLTNTEERSELLRRLKDIKYLLPSIYTLQKDFKYLRLCTDTMKRLLQGKKRIPLTVQVLAYDAFSAKDPEGPNELFFDSLKRLYLYIMRDLVELTGEWPLLEDGEESPEVSFRQPGNWHRLAQEARRLGFESGEITRLAVTNPDEQVALKALQDARPASFYEYNTSELQDILNRIVHEFSKARSRTFEDRESTFTTIGAGEPINRRCGRQYSGSYIRDRWSFELSTFSQTIAESRDITSLFVRKSVFHAFWRLNEDPDGDEPMLHPGNLPMASLETSPVDSPEAHAEYELNDEPMLETNNSHRQSGEGRPSCQRSRGKSLRTKKRGMVAKRASTKQKMRRVRSRTRASLRSRLSKQQQPQRQIQPEAPDTLRLSSQRVGRISDSALNLVRAFGQDVEIKILQYDGADWKAKGCRRGSISREINDLKTQLGNIHFYHPEGRAVAEHEVSQYEVICVVPQNYVISDASFPAEEEL
ncbi:hypothetical protein ACHAPI_011358 [Fusarium lateritium]